MLFGTPRELVDHAAELSAGGLIKVEKTQNDRGQNCVGIQFVTGGWSGTETVSGFRSKILFHDVF